MGKAKKIQFITCPWCNRIFPNYTKMEKRIIQLISKSKKPLNIRGLARKMGICPIVAKNYVDVLEEAKIIETFRESRLQGKPRFIQVKESWK